MAPSALSTPFTGSAPLPGAAGAMPTMAIAMARLRVRSAADDKMSKWAAIEGLSGMQSRPMNSRRWIAPGTAGGADGLTFRAPKKEKDVHVEAVDFTADLSRLRSNSRKWSATRAEASRIIRSSGWRAPKVEIPSGTDLTCSKDPPPGADIEPNAALVRRIAAMMPGIGGFGGLYPSGDDYLVACTDGVGMKLRLAFETGIHDTIGLDLVAMTMNDIVTSGAEPLFFIDYFATGKLDVEIAEKVIHGIVEGCRMSNCALLGGETVELPGLYEEGAYDLSGFGIGKVPKGKLVDGTKIQPGDIVIGLPSSGVHTDGYDAIQKYMSMSGASFEDKLPGCPLSLTIGESLMAPTTIYVPEAITLCKSGGVKAIAHVTGDGLLNIINHMFPEGLSATIDIDQWRIPPLFKWLQIAGLVHPMDMFYTFNMGIGLVVILDPHAAHRVLSGEEGIGMGAYRLGHVYEGKSDISWHHRVYSMI